jgi:hypothetical protein
MDNDPVSLRTVNVLRYLTPLREGGSLPAIAEADDDFLYVLKFRGAGQGTKALISELIGGELARFLGLRVPEIVFAELNEGFGRTEPDEEIQDLLKASTGLNLAMHYSLLVRCHYIRSRGYSGRTKARFGDRMARQFSDQRRPHRPKHQHAYVAQGIVAYRPWCGAVFSSFMAELGGAGAQAVCAGEGPRAVAQRNLAR